ncbi:MAG: hypothetical protein K6G56_04925 [Clostridiales bacterium]|nr:hypothetical protein [Clostridiales bacterium]
MRFYIATGIHNAGKASALAEVLKRRGHEQTYDWTVNGDIRREGAARMSEVAFNELRAVRDAELVVVLLPGGSGTHTELGLAIATRGNKRIILWSEHGDEFNYDERACTFYFHPCIERIICPFEELLARLDREQIGSDITRMPF